MATFWDQIKNFVPGVQQIFQNAGYNQQQGNRSVVSGLIPRALGGTGLVAPAKASDSATYTPTQNPTTTTNPVITGGGSVTGGTGGSPTQTYDQGAPYESAPDQPSIDYNAIFAPAFEALQQQEAATQAGTEADIASAEQGTAQRKAGLESEQTRRLDEFGNQRAEAKQTTGSVIDQSRRQASELLQGIQARYGGTTGTGRFQSEILGAQATGNIATNQAALQNTMGKIGQAENQLKTEVMNLINQEDERLTTQKAQLRAQLQQSLADIGKERGRLESEKAQMRIDNLNQYQQVLAGINQRNTEFKQKMFLEAQQGQTQLDALRAKAQEQIRVATYKANLSSPTEQGGLTQQPNIGVGQIGTNPEDELNAALGITG